jgi:NDP-sugar pyrophosphorylase family protein
VHAVILAAGQGRRLQPVTSNRSKAMAPVLGKPIVERVMEQLAEAGVDEFVVVASPADDDIVRHFAGESQIQGRVQFAYQEQRLGTAHALQCAAPLIRGDFFLSACDNLVAEDQTRRMRAEWLRSPRPHALLSLMQVGPEEVSRGAVVDMDGPWVTRIVEKPTPEEAPSCIYSLPLYCFSPRILDHLSHLPPSPRGEYELQDAIQRLIEHDGGVRGLTLPWRLTLTTPHDLLAINRYYMEREGDRLWVEAGAVGVGTRLVPPVYVEPGAVIGRGCTIGPYVYVERDCTIGEGVILSHAVVLRASNLADGSCSRDQVIGPTRD